MVNIKNLTRELPAPARFKKRQTFNLYAHPKIEKIPGQSFPDPFLVNWTCSHQLKVQSDHLTGLLRIRSWYDNNPALLNIVISARFGK